MKTYQEILKENQQTEINTDYGVLRATHKTMRDLIKQGDRTECYKFAQYVYEYWGQFQGQEMMGDIKDANL